jgi:predicted alpha/beta superfamily hydrolase
MSEASEPNPHGGAEQWQAYAPPQRAGGFAGSVMALRLLYSPQLGNTRDILAWLPPGYDTSERRYPVIYMHDGQNLFDDRTSFAGAWRVDVSIADARSDAIVVGIPNMGSERAHEYGPWPDAKHGGGRADAYVRYIVETVRPRVDAAFRTRPDRAGTGIAGSSLGGLVSLYGFFRFPAVFGFCAALSPALWFAHRRIFEFVEESPFTPGRIYLDCGTREGEALLADVRRLCELLRTKGYQSGRELLCVLEPGGAHNEQAWAARMRRTLDFLLRTPGAENGSSTRPISRAQADGLTGGRD